MNQAYAGRSGESDGKVWVWLSTFIRTPAWWAVVATGLTASLIMALVWPFNYDEGFNYLYYADRGFRFTITDYAYPNNHMLFTLVQGTIPRRLVDLEPLVLRLPNLFVSVTLVVALAWDRTRLKTGPLRALAIVFAGPFALQYFGQARGFQLGTVLAALGLLAAIRLSDRPWGPVAAAGLLALAAWSVPTFAFGAPVVAVWLLLRRDVRGAFTYSALFLGIATLLYAPVLGQLVSDRTNSFSTFRPLGEYAGDLVSSSFFLPLGLSIVAFVLGISAWLRSTTKLRDSDNRSAKTFLFGGFCLAFVLVAELLPLADISASPFVRNASFFPAFVLFGLWNAPWSRFASLAIAVLIGLNVMLGIGWVSKIADGSGVVAFRGTVSGQTPRLDELIDMGVAELHCGWTDEWTCRLYEARLRAAGIKLVYPLENVPSGPCVVGEYPPLPGTGIEVVERDGATGLVCYG